MGSYRDIAILRHDWHSGSQRGRVLLVCHRRPSGSGRYGRGLIIGNPTAFGPGPFQTQGSATVYQIPSP